MTAIFAALGRSAQCSVSACGSLVTRRSYGRGRYRDHGLAAKHDYVVLTYDLDFSAILAATHGVGGQAEPILWIEAPPPQGVAESQVLDFMVVREGLEPSTSAL
jgi:hypothetical protein